MGRTVPWRKELGLNDKAPRNEGQGTQEDSQSDHAFQRERTVKMVILLLA